MDYSTDDLLRIGNDLRRVIGTDGFAHAVKLQEETYKDEFANSHYGDKAGREQSFLKLTVLRDLVGTMQTLAMAAEHALLSPDEEEDL